VTVITRTLNPRVVDQSHDVPPEQRHPPPIHDAEPPRRPETDPPWIVSDHTRASPSSFFALSLVARALLSLSRMSPSKNRFAVKATVVAVVAAVAVGWVAGRARAGGISASKPMKFEGTILEQGVPVNGQRDITINLYDDGTAGTLLCSTPAGSTSVVQGRFVVQLVDACTPYLQGSATGTILANRPDSWVEVQVAQVSFGRQKIGAVPYAVMAGAVNGVVTSTSVLPAAATDGLYGRGGGGASIYNDGTAQSLVITGNNGGGPKKITLADQVSVTSSLSAASLAATGDITTSGGRVGIGVYVNTGADVADVACNSGDVAISGGSDCHADFDQMLLQSHPNLVNNVPVGWHFMCMNHSNSGLQNAPKSSWVLCMSHGR